MLNHQFSSATSPSTDGFSWCFLVGVNSASDRNVLVNVLDSGNLGNYRGDVMPFLGSCNQRGIYLNSLSIPCRQATCKRRGFGQTMPGTASSSPLQPGGEAVLDGDLICNFAGFLMANVLIHLLFVISYMCHCQKSLYWGWSSHLE